MRSSVVRCQFPTFIHLAWWNASGGGQGCCRAAAMLKLVISVCLVSQPLLCRAVEGEGATVEAAKADQVQSVSASDGTTAPAPQGDTASQTSVARELPKPPDRPVPPRSLIRSAIDRDAVRYGLDPLLLHAIVSVESAYDPHAVSSAGAVGLMQLMPETAADYGVSEVDQLFDLETNLQTGSRHLKRLIEKYGSIGKAVMAYNAGEGALERSQGVVDYPETRLYTYQVLSRYLRSKGIPLYSERADQLLGMAMMPDMATAGATGGARPPVAFRPAASNAVGFDGSVLSPPSREQPSRSVPTRLQSRLAAPNNSLLNSHLEDLSKRRERFSSQARQRYQAQSRQAQTFGYPDSAP